MTGDEVRTAFLSFFEKKGHKVIPSSSLIPRDDPTLLLTNAGMVQFKPYFLGEAEPPAPRLASCQKCFRTTDITSVGDPGHLTFFEMLGNFSVGNYFKREAINWAWEFVTKQLKLSPRRLWVTIFLDDDESFNIWRKVGVPEKRILRFGEEDNFWGPAGDSGPCGPCSEIHYDFGEKVGCGKPSCAPNCGCARFSEIWNLVFTQYNQDKDGNRTQLSKPHIDTGMGLERTAAVVQGKTSVYETDLFAPLLKCVSELTGKQYGSNQVVDNAMRVIAEHARGIAFLVADGVIPNNEGRGYVLRRLLRRTSLFGRRLGLDKPFIKEIAKATIAQMGHIYPELAQRQEFILQVTELEEARFSATLSTGLELLDRIMEEEAGEGVNKISGEQAFKLYDTYGFPVELTEEIAAERGFSVDSEGFERKMEGQRERAKEAQKVEVTLTAGTGLNPELNIERTDFVGYDELKCQSTILELLAEDKSTATIKDGQEAGLILEATPFYAEMGGQVGDTGEIRSSSGRFVVTNTILVPPNIFVHQGKVAEGSLSIGDEVEAEVDEGRRLDIARNHTATHLLQSALRQVLGEHVQQRGSLVAPDRLRFDFSHLTALTKKRLAQVNQIVNDKIRQNFGVSADDMPYDKAINEGAIAIFDEKYGDEVRVVKISETVISAELCGGTHVSSTGEVGFFHVISESSIGSGLRRIEAVTGRGAEEYVNKSLSDLQEIARSVEASLDNVKDRVSKYLTAERDKLGKQVLALERELARLRAESLLGQAEVIKGVTVLVANIPSSRLEILREMSDFLRGKLKSAIIVLGTVYEDKPAFLAVVTPDLVAKGYNAGDIVKQVAGVTGGSGGGKPGLAQAGGKDKKKLDEALKMVKGLI